MIDMRTRLVTAVALVLGLSASIGFAATSSTAGTRPRPTATVATRPSPSATPRVPKAPATPASPRQLTISIDWGDAMTTRESGLWIGYLFARMDFIGRNGGRYHRVPGVIIPVFDEEVFARGEAAKIYRNLKQQNKAMESPYFNDLEKVDAAGFMPEYVWRYLKRNQWSTVPPNLRAAEFDRWSRGNLASNHAPETRGNVVFSTSGS
jgi:hypothetical protein